jgi:hypothetical protein
MSDPILDFCVAHELQRRIYLADGVYAGHDGYQLWLMTNRDGSVHAIALDNSALAALLAYIRRAPDDGGAEP